MTTETEVMNKPVDYSPCGSHFRSLKSSFTYVKSTTNAESDVDELKIL